MADGKQRCLDVRIGGIADTGRRREIAVAQTDLSMAIRPGRADTGVFLAKPIARDAHAFRQGAHGEVPFLSLLIQFGLFQAHVVETPLVRFTVQRIDGVAAGPFDDEIRIISQLGVYTQA